MNPSHFLSLSRRLWWVQDRINWLTLDASGPVGTPEELAALRRRELRLSELILSFQP